VGLLRVQSLISLRWLHLLSSSSHLIFVFCILVSCTYHPSSQPFTNSFPRADIHELLSPDILHQLIKGTFKDHLVTWVGQYLIAEHGKTRAKEILDDIDQRFTNFIFHVQYGLLANMYFSIAAVPLFANLRRFPEGRGFKQWTGDDSKALMKASFQFLDLRCYLTNDLYAGLSARD